jgi:hypothetical protein
MEETEGRVLEGPMKITVYICCNFESILRNKARQISQPSSYNPLYVNLNGIMLNIRFALFNIVSYDLLCCFNDG